MEFGRHVSEHAPASDSPSATVIRGPTSWTSLYVLLGIVLSIESTLITMIPSRTWQLWTYLVALGLTLGVFLWCKRCQERLLRLIASWENRPR